MFDFFVYISKQQIPAKIRFDNVSTENYLKGIIYKEICYEENHFKISILIYENSNNSFYQKEDNKSIFILGNVFTNNTYAADTKSIPKRITPNDILKLYHEKGATFIDSLKGIFTILILDETKNSYHIFSSKNALYDTYFLEGPDFLIASSSIEAMLKFPGIKSEIDPIAIIQHSVFDYPLGEKTLFSNINILPPSYQLSYDLDKTTLNQYFNYLPLLNQKHRLTWKETYLQTTSQFNEAIDLLIEGNDKLCASITSGFDSRTNLSRLYGSGKDILYYSWGMPGSIEIKIPELISKKIVIPYEPIFLDKEFEESYDYYSKQAVMWSGGKGTIRRANHTYGYSKLYKHSQTIITGLFGSELLRPTNAVGHIFNQAFIDVLYSDQQELKLSEIFEQEVITGFLNPQMLKQNKNEFINRTLAYFTNLNEVGEKYLQLYYFFLTEGFRKYFGHEIHGCRAYVKILSPYIDDDFVEFILNTPIPLQNKYAFKRNPKSLKIGQSFYLPIMEQNLKKLMKIPTGRFYSPAQLSSIFFPFSVIPGFIRQKIKRKKNSTFNTHKWNTLFRNENPDTGDYHDELLNSLNNENHSESNEIEMAKQLSLRYWLIQNCENKKE